MVKALLALQIAIWLPNLGVCMSTLLFRYCSSRYALLELYALTSMVGVARERRLRACVLI